MLTDEQKQRRRESRRKWRQKNPEYNKQYKQKHKEHCKQLEASWRNSHKSHKSEYDKEYRKKNAERILERKRAYHVHRSSFHKRIYDDNIGEWKCYFCGISENVQLDIHHKDQDKFNNEPNNLVCLCKECHKSLHQRWLNSVIPQLIKLDICDWQGNIKVTTDNSVDI